MDYSAEGILERMKAGLKNEDTRIEGSFTMDNLQAVAEELARINAMRIVPLMAELTDRENDMGTSGNERHYVRWAKEAVDAEGNIIVGNARVSAPRDGTGFVSIAIVTSKMRQPTESEVKIVQEYIDSKRPVGANPVVSAAETMAIRVAGTVRAEPGYSRDMVLNNVKRGLMGYLQEIAFSSSTAELNYYTVSRLVSTAEGVAEIRNLAVNGGKESIVAEHNKYFSMEEMQIDVVE